MIPTSRSEALANGARRYFTGIACPHGHVSERMTSNCACTKCLALNALVWKRSNPNKSNAHSARSRKKHQLSVRERKAAYVAKNKKHLLVALARYRARRKGMAFDLRVEDISWPQNCPALGIVLNYAARGRYCAASPTLDRVDNEKGYVAGNVRVISFRANAIKSNATAEELRLVAKYSSQQCGV